MQKIERLRGIMASGDWGKALKLAASWPRLGEHKKAIEQGWAAYSNPSFYRQLGKDPEGLIVAGVNALRLRYR